MWDNSALLLQLKCSNLHHKDFLLWELFMIRAKRQQQQTKARSLCCSCSYYQNSCAKWCVGDSTATIWACAVKCDIKQQQKKNPHTHTWILTFLIVIAWPSIRYILDLVPHMKVATIFRFFYFCLHTAMKTHHIYTIQWCILQGVTTTTRWIKSENKIQQSQLM